MTPVPEQNRQGNSITDSQVQLLGSDDACVFAILKAGFRTQTARETLRN
jgi:hypothetical protein